MSINPIQYTSRTYDTILADINADPTLVDKPDWWKRMMAGGGEMLSLNNNAIANNNFLQSAFTRQAVNQLCANIDYALGGRSTASGTMLFDIIRTASLPVTVTQANLAATTVGSLGVSAKRFESHAGLTASATSETFATTAVNTTSGVITVAVDQYPTGSILRFSSTVGLPAGLSAGTDYYSIRLSATQIQAASTRALAFQGTPIIPSTQGSGTHTVQNWSYSVTCYQQTSIASYIAGISDGATSWQTFQLRDIGILASSIAVVINSVTWTKVTTFVNFISTDKVYKTIYNTDGSAFLQFSNGTYGAIPGAFSINVSYVVVNGSTSNVSTLNSITSYSGSDSNVSGCTNITAMSGGQDEEDINNARNLAPILLKARGSFISSADGLAFIYAHGGVSLAAIVPNYYGPLSVRIVGIATGGGDVGSGTRTAIAVSLLTLTILNQPFISFDASTITPFAVTSSAKVTAGKVWASDVEPYFRLGWKLFFSPSGKEITDKFKSASGIAGALTLINTIFSEAYAAVDYPVITNLLNELINIGYRNYGDYIATSDAIAFIQAALFDRIQYMTITSTTPSLPYQEASSEISNYGALTLVQI